MKNLYVEYNRKWQKKVNEFPLMAAFSDKQFEEGMRKLGLEPTDTDKIVRICGGCYIRKSDKQAYIDLGIEQEAEFQRLMEEDTDGSGFIKQMFEYELGNHEYCITYDYEETLDALGYALWEVKKDPKLRKGLALATASYLQKCEENGWG